MSKIIISAIVLLGILVVVGVLAAGPRYMRVSNPAPGTPTTVPLPQPDPRK